ncbi:probable phosphorylase b kinase regulatory subunit beta [Cylas formicarius]|uniref:probable phosphorylase b kinase regulatory subunit beta n=1 Tax=Cylas formicarius TaxID=197179 RepID=UPI00295878D0|nr:probable phosphorylase b kinase regulatory subunit beta [Cylas formicarius]
MTVHSSIMEDINFDQFIKTANYEETVRQLDVYYGTVKRQLLRYQSPITGLFPVFSGDTEVGSIRDSVYCAAAVWGLYQAYRRIDDDRGKSYELGQSTVKCMRGILECWMKQSLRVELFKKNQCVAHALHVKFHLTTGNEVFSDDEYNHLQIDVVSVYLLFLVQMITSGLQIIYTQDEVAFIQNLVYYVERAYRTPDFGMWERGSKYNDGSPEIHASSIGIAKSALEAINGCNLFGEKGASWSVVYVDIDAHNRNRSIFETLLPRESCSKEVDSSLLATISYPAFATHEDMLYNTTKNNIVQNLRGHYGFKRFTRDGYKTVLEDPNQKYYKKEEIKNFEGIECEWPLFYIFMIIDGVFKNLPDQIVEYQELLKKRIFLDHNEDPVIPMFYFVSQENVEKERSEQHTTAKNMAQENNGLFLWNQAMFILAQLLTAGLLHINELDPIRRYLPSYNRPRKGGRYSAFQAKPSIGTATDLVVQIVLIAESMRLQAMMATYGIQTQTPHEVEPVQIWSSTQLVQIYQNLGVNKKMKLHGRPERPIGSLGTSKLYRICGATVLCYPLIFEVSDFYLYRDMALLIDDIKTELQFVGRYWRLSGRPTVCLLIREEHMRDPQFKKMLDLLAMLKKGYCDNVKVRIGRLQNLISSSCVEHLDFMNIMEGLTDTFSHFQQLEHDYIGYQSLTDVPRVTHYNDELQDFSDFKEKPTNEIIDTLKNQESLYARAQLYGFLLRKEGKHFAVGERTVEECLQRIYHQGGCLRHWAAVRYTSSLLHHTVDSISPFITAVLVHGKQLTVGVIGQKETVFDKPMTPSEIQSIVYSTIQPYDIIQAVLQQEVTLYCGRLISTNPELFKGILKIRVGWVLEAMKYFLEIFESKKRIEAHSPYQIRQLLYKVLSLKEWASHDKLTPLQRRQLEGCLCRVPASFYNEVWDVMLRTPKGIIVEGRTIPQEPTMSNMSRSDLTFSLLVEQMLNHIHVPEYRQLIVELLTIVATILGRNPELTFSQPLDLKQLIKDAAHMYAKDHNLTEEKVSYLMEVPYIQSTGYLARATVNTVLKGGQITRNLENECDASCRVSLIMSSREKEYAIFLKNEVLKELSLSRINSNTVLMGQIVIIESKRENGDIQIRCLRDNESFEPLTFFTSNPESVLPIPKKLWQYIASIASPQERVKLAKNKSLCEKLMTISKDVTVGFIDSEDVKLGTIKYMGKVKGLGYSFGIELHEKNKKSRCNGSCAGIQYFQCLPGYAVFTTIERVVPSIYANKSESPPPVSDLDICLQKNISSFLNGGLDKPPHEEVVTRYGEYSKKILPNKNVTYIRNSLSLQNISDSDNTSVNTNNDFDQNTIIQPEKTHLMNENKIRNKSEMDIHSIHGSVIIDQSRKNLDKNDNINDKYYAITNANTINNRGVRNKSGNPISHLIDGTTLKRSKFYTNSVDVNERDKEHKDPIKKQDNNKKINERNEHQAKATSTFYVNSEPKYADPLPGSTNDLVIGSLVEVLNDVADNPLYGVVRWMGVEKDTNFVLVGVELEEEGTHLPLTLTDGTHNGDRFFQCATNRALFVPLEQCHKDARFEDGIPTPVHQIPSPEGVECPVIPGAVAPLCMATEEDVEAVCGKYRGIQGHHNSCYLDVTLFSMFTYTSVFDSLIFRPKNANDVNDYDEVQRVLREEIVNPLRKNLFVSADHVMNLRRMLDRLSSVSGLTSEEKDPEEFLNSLLAQILKAEPFLKLNSGQEAFYYQLFVEKDADLTLPTVQQLCEQSFLTSDIKLKEVPSCLILQMPRFGKNYKMYPRILPSQLLDVTDIIDGSPRQCFVCGILAKWECRECFGGPASQAGLESTSFCLDCLHTAHRHEMRQQHKPRELVVDGDFLVLEGHCRPPRLFMELFAVICIETSHYVAFVKCGVGHKAPWCFFDSMADRRGEKNGYNIPEMVACPDVSHWLSEEFACRQLHEDFPVDRHLPEHARRLLCDAYICMYQSSDVMMYR